MHTRLLLGAAFAALASTHLAAHDFWLAAADWAPAPNAPVTITAGVGEHFPTRTNFRIRENWLAEWRLIGAGGDVPVTKDFRKEDLVAATDVTLPSPGAYLGVAMVSAATIEMKGAEFTDYLKEEGLDSIIAAREAAGESDKSATERYARYAKVAIRNGEGSAAHLLQPVGLKAEFVPASDPTSIQPGSPLTVQLLVDGAPVAGAAISAVSDGVVVKGQTDGEGRVTLAIDREGAWLVKTIHMIRLPQAESPGPEWESYWVTLSFHTAGAPQSASRGATTLEF